ncbi:MAG: hypothetical protein ACLRS8_18185 [Parabacteroides merdae]
MMGVASLACRTQDFGSAGDRRTEEVRTRSENVIVIAGGVIPALTVIMTSCAKAGVAAIFGPEYFCGREACLFRILEILLGEE